MSQQYDNELRGSLFANKDKKLKASERDTSNWADAQGKIQVAGVEFYVSAWTKVINSGNNAGQRFQSLSLRPVNEEAYNRLKNGAGASNNQPASAKPANNIPNNFDSMDDDLPF